MNNHLRNIDFAALATLRLVYRRGSFTAAAAELNVKQSSVSYTIEKLRLAFNDPLFVRQGGGIAPTERCAEIVATAEHILSDAERAALPSTFDPSTSTASVTILATYLSRSAILPDVVREIRSEAPGVSVEFIMGFGDAGSRLLSGRADLALTPIPVAESGILGRELFKMPHVCLVDPGNPLARNQITREKFAAASHLVINYGQNWRPPYLISAEELGLDMKIAVTTPDPYDVRLLLPGTDLVAVLPRPIAERFSDVLHLCPCPLPAITSVQMFWPARLDRSPLHAWIREKILRASRRHRKR